MDAKCDSNDSSLYTRGCLRNLVAVAEEELYILSVEGGTNSNRGSEEEHMCHFYSTNLPISEKGCAPQSWE